MFTLTPQTESQPPNPQSTAISDRDDTRFVGCAPMKTGTRSRQEAYVADRTNIGALPLTGPLEDIDLLEPEPSVAVVADSAVLRRRIVAALDFDRLPVAAL